jgi:hypothetical protein
MNTFTSRKLSLCLCAIILGLSMVSCSETLSPRITVVDHSPPDGAENVSPDSAIEVIFSYKINRNSVHGDSFVVTGEQSGYIAGSFSFHNEGRNPDRRVAFQPGKTLEPDELVTVELSSSIRSSAGTSLEAFSFSFSVDPGNEEPEPVDPEPEPPVEATPLTVTSITPAPFATGIHPLQVIEIGFSDSLNPFTANRETVLVHGAVSGHVAVAVQNLTGDGQSLRIIPQRPYAPGEKISINLLDGISSVTGKVFAGYSFTFHAAAFEPAEEGRRAVNYQTNGSVLQMLVIDLDGDSQPETVHINEDGRSIEIITYLGNGTFASAMTFEVEQQILSIAASDVDMDGDYDLLLGLGNCLRTVWNNTRSLGQFNLAQGPETFTRAAVRSITVTDLDHRVPADIIMNTDSGLRVTIQGPGSSRTIYIGETLRARTPIVTADLDGNGHVDLVYGDSAGGLTYHLVDAGGNIGPETVLYEGVEASQVAVNDFNRDGIPDILVLLQQNESSENSPFILLAQDAETGEFRTTNANSISTGNVRNSFVTGDLSGQGALDLVLAQRAPGRISYYADDHTGNGFGQGSGEELLNTPEASNVSVADFDGDGVLDLVVSSTNELHYLLSDWSWTDPVEPVDPVEPQELLQFSAGNIEVSQGDDRAGILFCLTNTQPVDALSLIVGFDPAVVQSPSANITGLLLRSADFTNWQIHEEEVVIGGILGHHAMGFHAIVDFLPPYDGNTIPAGQNTEIVRMIFDVSDTAPPGVSVIDFPQAAGTPPIENTVVILAQSFDPEVVPGTITVAEVITEEEPTPHHFMIDSVTGAPGDSIVIPIRAVSETEEIEGFTVAGTYDPEIIEITSLTLVGSDTIQIAPDWIAPRIMPEIGCFTMSALFDVFPPFESRGLTAGQTHILFAIEARILTAAPYGQSLLVLADGFAAVPGGPPLENNFTRDGVSYTPALHPGSVTVVSGSAGPLSNGQNQPGGSVFLRGDINGDGVLSEADSARLMNWIFGLADTPDCLDAADLNDDGYVNITDSTQLLNYLNTPGSPPPSSPFPVAGVDTTPDTLSCNRASGD